MSTAERSGTGRLPALAEGQRLDRATFHRRYEAMPPGTWAELLDGVVRMSSPVGFGHARNTLPAGAWLIRYEQFTPGVEALDNVSTALDDRNEVQPDILLRRLPEAGGRTRVEDGILAGPPAFVLEVAGSSRRYDLGPKLEEYRRAGVLEYVVCGIDPDEIYWHVRRGDALDRVPAGPDGWYRSEAFPGLWLDPAALLARDLGRLFAALDLGIATPEHAAFVARIGQGL